MIMPREILFVWVAAATVAYGYFLLRIVKGQKQQREKAKPAPGREPEPKLKMEEYQHA